MNDDGKSFRQILRSTSIIGGATVINILIGLVRIKVVAIMLGPAGVGLIGLFNNLIDAAANVAALGTGTVGTRQIAEAAGREDAHAVADARRALFLGTLALAISGTVVFWALRDALALWVLGDATLSPEVGWLALAVGLTVAAASQSALLNGMRRIGDLAKVSVWSGMLSTALGVGALLLWGRSGLIVFVLVGPLTSLMLGHVYVARLPKVIARRTPLPALARQWGTMVKLGTALMVAGLAGTLGQLLVRMLVQRELDAEALGYFQAAATLSMTYFGIVLGAMGTDFYPRLTAVIHDNVAVNRLVNEQVEVALLIASPILLAMIGLAPWVIQTLYSSSFHPAAEVLRWQVIGDVFKVYSWPLGFMFLAAGAGRTLMLTEFAAAALFVLLTWKLLPAQGIVATGQAFVGMYLVYLSLVYWLGRRRTGFRWNHRVLRQMTLLLLTTVSVMIVSAWIEIAGVIIGTLGSMGLALYGFGRLGTMVNLEGRIGEAAKFSRRLLGKIGIDNG